MQLLNLFRLLLILLILLIPAYLICHNEFRAMFTLDRGHGLSEDNVVRTITKREMKGRIEV
jgi:hypothetical protein